MNRNKYVNYDKEKNVKWENYRNLYPKNKQNRKDRQKHCYRCNNVCGSGKHGLLEGNDGVGIVAQGFGWRNSKTRKKQAVDKKKGAPYIYELDTDEMLKFSKTDYKGLKYMAWICGLCLTQLMCWYDVPHGFLVCFFVRFNV